jgi:hypothetical protein
VAHKIFFRAHLFLRAAISTPQIWQLQFSNSKFATFRPDFAGRAQQNIFEIGFSAANISTALIFGPQIIFLRPIDEQMEHAQPTQPTS